MSKTNKQFAPEALVYILKEVERELRRYGRVNAARLVGLSANAISEDAGPGPLRH